MKKIKATYAKAREDAQLAGVIPTEPVGAVRNEVVSTSDAPQPGLLQQALRNGWEVPHENKPRLVDEMTKIIDDPNIPVKVKVAAFNALRMADQQQYERDHPEVVAKLKGQNNNQTVNVGVTSNVVVGEVFSDIENIEKSVGVILNGTNSTPNSSVRADSNAEPMDETEPNTT